MGTIDTIVDRLYLGFDKCRVLKEHGEGGAMRAVKGETWETFGSSVLEAVIALNKLPFTVESNKKIKVGGISVTMDNCILNGKKPLFHVEDKDYIDIKMYKTFLGDNLALKKSYPDMKFISLSGWVACDRNTQSSWNSVYGLLNGSIYTDTLLSEKRKAEDNLFILNFPKKHIVLATEKLIERLAGFIK